MSDMPNPYSEDKKKKIRNRTHKDLVPCDPYQGRPFGVYIINTSYLIRGLYKVGKNFMTENVAAFFTMCDSDVKGTLHKIVSPDCLEKRFGGLMENKKSGFWPPDMNIPGHKLIPIPKPKVVEVVKDVTKLETKLETEPMSEIKLMRQSRKSIKTVVKIK
jgi:hypothetical protein